MAGIVETTYAKSLFEVAAELDKLEVIGSELAAVSKILSENGDFVRLLSSPAVSKADKTDLIGKVFDGKTDGCLLNFLKVLAQNGRFSHLAGIADEFKTLLNKEKNILAVTAVTAVEMPPILQQKLRNKLAAITKKNIELTAKVDRSLLGGVLLQYDNVEIDGTVREKLTLLKRQIQTQVI